jgi:GNAT superfamily N-acetyltransferase
MMRVIFPDILSSSTAPHHLAELQKLFSLEWGEIDLFANRHQHIAIPAPLLALFGQNKLAGGLSFTSYTKPDKESPAIWINAVFVVPECRRMGIASKLVREAEIVASRLSFNELFVLTDIPDLYQQLNWALVEEKPPNSILVRLLANV